VGNNSIARKSFQGTSSLKMDKIAAKIDAALGNDLILHRVGLISDKVRETNVDMHVNLLLKIFTSLEDIIQVKLEEPSTSDRKLAELKLILDLCGHLDYAVAVHACSTVVSLTVKGLLSVEESLIALTATTSTAKLEALPRIFGAPTTTDFIQALWSFG
jgi:hypothetical protein